VVVNEHLENMHLYFALMYVCINHQLLLTAGRVCRAYVFPLTMRLSYMMFPYMVVLKKKEQEIFE